MVTRYAVFLDGLFCGYLELTPDGVKRIESAGYRLVRSLTTQSVFRKDF